MENFISPIIAYLEKLSQHVPLEIFTFVGTFLEEVIPPIPSPFVLTTAGTITKAQNNPLSYILLIAVIGAVSKTLGGWVLYIISDKAEDFFLSKIGRFIGVSQNEVEKIGKYLNGGWKDKIVLFVLRATPIAPSSPISITCGIIKLNINTFLIATFLGTIIRNLFYLYLGYTGLAASESMASGLKTGESLTQVLIIAVTAVLLLFGYSKRKKIFGGETNNTESILETYAHAITPEIEKKYSKKEISKALEKLTYHNPDPLPKEESDKFSTIYVFRHGESTDNRNFIFSGWRKSSITEIGKHQAEVLAEKFKDKKIDMLISSPQERAIQTIKVAMSKNEKAKNLKIETDERIKERSYGDLQGKSKLLAYLENSEDLKKIRRSWNGTPPNGESIETVCKRVAEFCDELIPKIKGKNINVAISCHGNSIRGFRKYFEGLSEEETAKIETPLGQDYAAYVIKN